MQEVWPVERDFHAAGQQLLVTGLLGEICQRLVVAGRQDQLHLHPGQCGNAQGVEGAVVGHEIRRGDDQPALGQVDQGLHRVARVWEWEGRAAGQELQGHVLVLQRPRRGNIQHLPGLQVPVDREHRFHVGDPRAADFRHQLAVGMAGHEPGRRQVLRSNESHIVINHRQLAVVAQVHPSAAPPAQAAGQHVMHLYSGGAQGAGVGAQPALGADCIQQQAAVHAPPGGPNQRLHHRIAHGVVVHQVIQKVRALLRRIDRADQRLQRTVVVIQQFHRIAAHRHEPAQPLDQGNDLAVGVGTRWSPAQRRLRRLAFADRFGCLGLPAYPFARQPRVAEQQVQGQAHQGQESHQQQPAACGGRRGAGGDPEQGGNADQPVDGQQPQADVGVVLGHGVILGAGR